MDQVQKGDVLVADMTDPNWEPVMKRAAAVVTNRGGRTCHAAIIARELGIPAICGCGHATDKLKDGDLVTVSCTEGDTGYVYTGALDYEVITHDISAMPELPVEIKMNGEEPVLLCWPRTGALLDPSLTCSQPTVFLSLLSLSRSLSLNLVGNPEMAFQFSRLPNSGVGLARIEFIINNVIGIHPKAILELDHIPRVHYDEIMRRSQGYASPQDFFIDKLAEGVSTIAAAFWPNEVIVRLSDYKSNEYRKLLCGEMYEPTEENPMLGFR
jgi:pyruvate,water dikinase